MPTPAEQRAQLPTTAETRSGDSKRVLRSIDMKRSSFVERMEFEEEDDPGYGTFGNEMQQPAPATALSNAQRESKRKWLMVAILSALTAINQGICYSYAPIASVAEARWGNYIHSTELITVYFVSYIPCSFVGSWLMDKKGLRFGVLLGAFLQAFGASLRYVASATDTSPAVEASLTLLGQVIASVAMPFMVNSPPVLSANWFPPSLRATSTSIAVNANALGIAFVYLTAPFIVRSSEEVIYWNFYVAIVSIAAALVGWVFFHSFPSSSRFETESIASDVQLRDEYDWKQWSNAFTHRGFWHTVVTFSVAECIVNAMSALLGKFLSSAGFSKAEIGVIGAAFIVSSLVGGQIISRLVDQKRNHITALQLCLFATALSMTAFKLVPKTQAFFACISLMFLGAALGPIQPIVLELGVECAFPTSEATVAALQQLCGNFLSAIFVPGLSILRRAHIDSSGHVPSKYFYASPEWVMVALIVFTIVVFCFYDGEYKRYAHEAGVIRPEALLSKDKSGARVHSKEYSDATDGLTKRQVL